MTRQSNVTRLNPIASANLFLPASRADESVTASLRRPKAVKHSSVQNSESKFQSDRFARININGPIPERSRSVSFMNMVTPETNGRMLKQQRDNCVVVLTGGPCGGKTTFIRELRASDPQCKQWLLVPEAAPLLFHAGLNAHAKHFQLAVAQLQIALEDACIFAAETGQAVVCDRGALDVLAYWLDCGWDEAEFFSRVGASREELLHRYDGVIHLQTTAISARFHYEQWPNAHRHETAADAKRIDELCAAVWACHTHYAHFANDGCNWCDKAQAARDMLRRLVSFPHSGIERE